MDIKQEFQRWLASAEDPEIIDELHAMEGDDRAIEDAFFQELAFG